MAKVSVWAACGTLAAFVLGAMANNGWVFEYPLDDVYIHLAMASEIANGGYGVNAGEYTSASSSPVYPFLFALFGDSAAQRWLPLVWNVAALIVAAALLGRAFENAELGRAGFWFAIAAPASLAMYATAFAGMENMAHTAASLAIVLGSWRFVESGRIEFLLIAGVLLAPAFRLEGLALTTAAGAIILILGRPLAGLGLMILGAIPVAIFAGYLGSLGLEPLPHSVIAKLADQGGTTEDGLLSRVSNTFAGNSRTYGGRFLLGLAIVTALIAISTISHHRRRAYVGLAVAVAGLAHLAFGATGWLDRYENYAVVSLVAVLALLLSTANQAVRIMVLAVAIVGGFLTYSPYVPNNIANMQAIHRQHGQMARFAKEFAKVPVAVNDLGYVAWRNPDYVLDLWGLASQEALELRLSGNGGAWIDPLADAKDVRLAMIYDHWLAEALGPGWVHLGTLSITAPGAFLGGPDVAFYARRATDVPVFSDQLEQWIEGLPKGARFSFAGERRG